MAEIQGLMLRAILDLGSNTFNLLIAKNDKTSSHVENKKISVKLLKKNTNNLIDKSAQKRGIDALLKHIKTIKEYNIKEVYAFATSAIRTSSNKQEYINKIKQKTGLFINVINGKKEAELIAIGVRNNLNIGRNKHLLMDIGGGSTEFIIANNKKIYWKSSYDLGVARLLNKFKPNDPISLKEIEKMNSFFENNLNELINQTKINNIVGLIGCSGSFESLAKIIIYKNSKRNSINNFNFDLNKLHELHIKLLKSNYKQRLKIKGLSSMRADMIVISSIFIIFILKKLKINKLQLSQFALKEGVLSTLNKKNSWQKSLL